MRPAYGWYALGVILVAYVLAFIDRQMVNLLVEPIKHDLRLSDVQISLLQGLAFALTLSVAALPLGRLIDVGRRSVILAAGVVLWSIMTALCGLAGTFPMLLLARAGVAGAEATMTPTALSMLGDYFPPRRIGLASGIYALGVHLGSGLALILGGWLMAGHLGWRSIFVAIAAPGALVALWAASLQEPPRGGVSAHPHPVVPWSEALAFLRNHGWAQTCANLAVGFALMATYGVGAWVSAFFARHYGWPARVFGPQYGLLTIFSGVSGVLLAAFFGDWLRGRGVLDARLRILCGAALTAAPLYAVAVSAESPRVTLMVLAAANLCNAAAVASGPGILQEIAPPRLRGLTHAFALLTVNLIALGLGPTVTAAFTDYILHDEQKVGLSLAIVPPTALVLAAVFGWMGRAPFRQAIRWSVQERVT